MLLQFRGLQKVGLTAGTRAYILTALIPTALWGVAPGPQTIVHPGDRSGGKLQRFSP